MKCQFPNLISIALLALLGGCNFSPPLDPNDPIAGSTMQAEVMQRNLHWASDFLTSRCYERQITRAKADDKLREYAEQLSYWIPEKDIDPPDAWRYGEVLRTAQNWVRTEQVYGEAAQFAKRTNNEDRFVNDTLHYAEALANNNKALEAIAAVRTTFSVSDKSKAPILFGTLYQVVPASLQSGYQVELAKLLEDAIAQHRKVIVDSNTPEGAAFISTRQHHVMKAWEKVIQLYRDAGRTDLAETAIKKRNEVGMLSI